MSQGEPVAGSGADLLDQWREEMNPRLARLQAFDLPRGFPFDYSRASLDLLAAVVRGRLADGLAPGDDQAGFVDAVIGYLGEALLRVGGGRWSWDEDPASRTYDSPLVCPDEELHRSPVAPLQLVIDAVRGDGGEFGEAYHALERAVAERRAADPSWSPRKEPTPGVDPILGVLPSAYLERWLPERAAAFRAWVEQYAGGTGTWDFSPESLDALETLVRGRLTKDEDFDDPGNQDFVEGAVWYLGEVARREKDAQWCYNAGEPDPYDPWVGRPYVKQHIPNGNAMVPFLTLENAVESDERGYLRGRLGRFR